MHVVHPTDDIPRVPDLAALTRAYRLSKAAHEQDRDAWHSAVVECVDTHKMRVRDVAAAIGVCESRVHAIIARHYSHAAAA